jgi:hypothetical protein
MWDQSPGAPALRSAATSAARMSLMRPAMPASSACHSAHSAGLPSTSAATAAPWMGGLEYITRTQILSWDSTRPLT